MLKVNVNLFIIIFDIQKKMMRNFPEFPYLKKKENIPGND